MITAAEARIQSLKNSIENRREYLYNLIQSKSRAGQRQVQMTAPVEESVLEEVKKLGYEVRLHASIGHEGKKLFDYYVISW